MLLYYECPTPIFHFAKRRNRTHHHRAEHKPGGNSDDAGGGHNRSYRTAEYQPLLRRIFGCAFFYHCRSPTTYRTFKKNNLKFRRSNNVENFF